MSNSTSEAVVSLLQEEHRYEEKLPLKAVNKLLYLVEKEARNRGIDLTIPHFWYQFGVVSIVRDAGAEVTPNQQILSDDLRPITQTILDRYYATSLEAITDETYQDAPYEVQRHWRTLDKQVRTHHNEYRDFFDEPPSRSPLKDSIRAVYDTFPTDQFPQYESDLLTWYSLITREVNRDKYDPERMMNINLTFWRIFALQLAEDHRHAASRQEVKDALDIDSFEAEQKRSRSILSQVETNVLDEKFKDDHEYDTPATRATDALATSLIHNYAISD